VAYTSAAGDEPTAARRRPGLLCDSAFRRGKISAPVDRTGAARLYAEAARQAPNLPEHDHLVGRRAGRGTRRPRFAVASLTIVPVDVLLVAKPWTYWMALPLTVMSAVALVGIVFNYLRKAVAAKYPKQ